MGESSHYYAFNDDIVSVKKSLRGSVAPECFPSGITLQRSLPRSVLVKSWLSIISSFSPMIAETLLTLISESIPKAEIKPFISPLYPSRGEMEKRHKAGIYQHSIYIQLC